MVICVRGYKLHRRGLAFWVCSGKMETIKALWKLNLKLIPPGQIACENFLPSGKTRIPSSPWWQQKIPWLKPCVKWKTMMSCRIWRNIWQASHIEEILQCLILVQLLLDMPFRLVSVLLGNRSSESESSTFTFPAPVHWFKPTSSHPVMSWHI